MATRRPRSSSELLTIYGMGPSRAESYGDGFLAIIAS
jgi:hypothetical protein